MSAERVRISDGTAFVSLWNRSTRAREERKKAEQVLSDVLQFPLDVESTTFAQFFEFIAREAALYERIFNASMYGHPLGPYIDEIARPAGDPGGLEFVKVDWYAERFEGKIELAPAFGGYGKWDTHHQDGTPDKGGIAIEFTPLNDYKDLPLRLDTSVEIHDLETPDKEPYRGVLELSVYDVVSAILFEITWSGDISRGRKTPFVLKSPKDWRPKRTAAAVLPGPRGETR